MDQAQRHQILTTTASMSLESLDKLTFAILNNGVQLYGKVPPSSMAYEPCKKLGLIQDDGTPFDLESLQRACAIEVDKRIAAGTL